LDRRTLQAHRNKTQDLNWSHKMRTLLSAFLVLISLTAAAAAESCPDVNWEARQTITVSALVLDPPSRPSYSATAGGYTDLRLCSATIGGLHHRGLVNSRPDFTFDISDMQYFSHIDFRASGVDHWGSSDRCPIILLVRTADGHWKANHQFQRTSSNSGAYSTTEPEVVITALGGRGAAAGPIQVWVGTFSGTDVCAVTLQVIPWLYEQSIIANRREANRRE
jgi:hypothetical protein